MKTILVPTDFSPCADKALQLAYAMAEKSGATLVLLHACNLVSEKAEMHYHTPVYTKPITQTAAVKLEVLKKNILQSGKATATVHLFDGDILESILDAEEAHHPDLIVMGTQGASGFKKLILGSKTAAAISKTSTPVLAIPAVYTGNTINNILLAVNDSDSNLNALQPVFDLAHVFNATVRMVIFSGSEEAATYVGDRRTITSMQTKLQEMYNQPNIETSHLTGKGFSEALQTYIDENNIDLLVMMTRRRTGLESLFNKSQTIEMAYQATIPLLVIHQE